MKSRKFVYISLVITFLLLATTNGTSQAGVSNRPVELPGQAGAAAAYGAPLGPPIVISVPPDVNARDPSSAYNKDKQEYLVVWWYDRPGCDDIFGRLVSSNGFPLAPRFPIANGCPGERSYPNVTYNTQHKEYLVVWNYLATSTNPPYCIQGQRLSETGALSGGVIDITDCGSTTTYAFYPAVDYSYASDKYEVVWSGRASSATSGNVLGQTVSSAGALIGTSTMIAQGDADFSYEYPDLAYNNRQNGYLVVYQRRGLVSPIYFDIYGHLVHGDGAPTGSPIEIRRVSSNGMYPKVAAMPSAFTKGQFLVVMEASFPPGNRWIDGRLINGDGSIYTNLFTIATPVMYDHGSPNVAANDENQQYLVTWTRFSPVLANTSWIYGLEVSTAGTLLSEEKFVGGLPANHSAVASGSHGDFLVTFDEEPTASPWMVLGVFWGTRYPVYLPLVKK